MKKNENKIREKLKPDDIDTVIYHHPCSDGFASALAVKVYMDKYHPEREIHYLPMNHGQPPPDVRGRSVLICDFSFKTDVMNMMISQATSLLILDHHETAQEALASIPDDYKVFDMSHSGAYLTWKYFFPDERLPLLIEYIEDRDIWTKKMPDGDDFVAWFYNEPFDFAIYEKYLDDDLLKEMIRTKGKHFSELNRIYIDMSVKHSHPKFIEIAGEYYFVGFANCTLPALKSDVGNLILSHLPLIDFSAVYSMNDKTNSTGFSLRSDQYHTSASMIAKKLGGGGHRNASGVFVPRVTNIIGKEIDVDGLYWKLDKVYFGMIELNWKMYTVVYFNSSIHKNKIGKYLLQTKYEDETFGQVQICQAIGNHYGEPVNTVHLAAVWDFDGTNTSYTIVYHPQFSETERNELNNWFKKDPSAGLKYAGFVNMLTPYIIPLQEPTDVNSDSQNVSL